MKKITDLVKALGSQRQAAEFGGKTHLFLESFSSAKASSLYDGSLLYCCNTFKNKTKSGNCSLVSKPDFLSLRFIESGCEYVSYKNQYFLAESGDLMIFYPHYDFAFFTRWGERCTKYNILIKGSMLENILKKFNQDNSFFLQLENPEIYLNYFSRFTDLLNSETPPNRAANAALCFEILQIIGDLIHSDDRPQQLRNMIQFIERHCCESLTLEKLAQQFNCSKSTINILFRRYLHTSTYRYITGCKMERAKMLFEEQMLSVKEVAEYLNFANQFSFSREFKKYFGCPPRCFLSSRTPLGMKIN